MLSQKAIDLLDVVVIQYVSFLSDFKPNRCLRLRILTIRKYWVCSDHHKLQKYGLALPHIPLDVAK